MANLIPQEDLLSIESVLYEPKVEELMHREIFGINTNFDPGADVIGFDVYDRTGAAKVFAGRARAKDLPTVGDKKERRKQGTYEIGDAIEYDRTEIAKAAAAARIGHGPTIRLDMLRPMTARRYIWEEESRLVWVGDSALGITGILDNSYYGNDPKTLGKKADVQQGAYSGTVAQKRQWEHKTPQEIIDDLTTGLTFVEDGNIFKGRTLVLPSKQRIRLRKPFGSDTPQTIESFLVGPGAYFENIVTDNRLKAGTAATGGNGDTVDYFMIIDNRPEVAQIATLQDINLFPPIYDELGSSRQAVTLITGGIMFRYPMAAYIGKGI